MAGITDIETLLASINPKKRSGRWVFVTLDEEQCKQFFADASLMYQEEEGITMILEEEIAKSQEIPYETIWGLITLDVHSDLAAVGFLAAVSKKLAEAGISVNCISAYYHDHLYVPIHTVDTAIKLLRSFS